MRKWIPGALLAVGVGAALARATLWGPESIPVKVTPTQRAQVASTITNSKAGTVRARRRARLSAEVGGRAVEILSREGQWVKAGDVLLRLDDASPRAQLRLTRESLEVAKATRHQACIAKDRTYRELERKKGLAERRIVSADLLDQLESAHLSARASCDALRAEVARAAAAIGVAEAALEKFVIRAPFDGVLAQQTVELGEWITPSPPLVQSPSVIDLIDPSSIYVSAPMDEVDSALVKRGQRAQVTVDSYPHRKFPARVVRVAPYVLDLEAQNRTVEIEVELDDLSTVPGLLPGTSADVEVILEVHENTLRIPTPALLKGHSVLILSEGRLLEQKVEVGLRNWDWVEITAGLEEGQLVVTSLDRPEVKAGARVRVEETSVQP